tara:strand:+ start:272 stop:505 length:234 start_codon:yes stop_codon:yes gene_type:complete
MDQIEYNNVNDNNNNKCYYLFAGLLVLSYIPLITFNVLVYDTLQDINNTINTPENLDYVSKIKYIIDDACEIVNCNI